MPCDTPPSLSSPRRAPRRALLSRLGILLALCAGVALAAPSAEAAPRSKGSKVRRSKRKRPRPPEPVIPSRSKADREADRHFKTGVNLFDERKFAEALAEFEQAYALKPHPLVLINLAAAHRALSQYDQAVDFYNRFLIEGEGKLSAEQLARGRTELDELLRQVARVEVITAPEGAEVQVDGRAIGQTPLDELLVLGPGDHTVAARLDGHHPAERKIRVAAGDTLEVEFALEVIETAPATPAAPARQIETPETEITVAAPPPQLRRFGVSASYGANALEVSDTGAPVVGVGFAITSRLSIGVDVVVTALSAVPEVRYRLFGETVSLHAIAAVPVTFKDGDESTTFAAGAGGLGIRYSPTGAFALRIETWVSYAGEEHGTTVPTFAGAEVWF
jgi:hypothetical protein